MTTRDQKPRYNVLICDDQMQIRYMLRLFLKEFGYGYFEAWDMQSTFRLLAQETVDVVMLDIMLDTENGLDILEKIRTLYPDLPVIMVTGVEEIDAAVRAMRAGAVDYIRKPFNLAEVQFRLETALAKRREARERAKYRDQLEEKIVQLEKKIQRLTGPEASDAAA